MSELPKVKHWLKGLVLDEVSLVDVPANKSATVALWKRDAEAAGGASAPQTHMTIVPEMRKGETTVDPQELQKMAESAEASVNALIAAMDKAGFDVTKTDTGYDVQKRAEPSNDNYVEIAGQRILKSDENAALIEVLKSQEDALQAEKARNDTLVAKAEEAEITKRAVTTIPNISGDEATKTALFKAVEKSDKKDDILKLLKSADAAVSKLFEELGDGAVDETSPDFKLNKMATDYASEKGIPFASAYAEVTKGGEGLALLKQVSNLN